MLSAGAAPLPAHLCSAHTYGVCEHLHSADLPLGNRGASPGAL